MVILLVLGSPEHHLIIFLFTFCWKELLAVNTEWWYSFLHEMPILISLYALHMGYNVKKLAASTRACISKYSISPTYKSLVIYPKKSIMYCLYTIKEVLLTIYCKCKLGSRYIWGPASFIFRSFLLISFIRFCIWHATECTILVMAFHDENNYSTRKFHYLAQ